MFNRIGEKLKGLATILCIIGIIISIIVGGTMASNEYLVGKGVLIMIVGSLFSWVSSFFIYGFGELIEKVSSIETALNPTQYPSDENREHIREANITSDTLRPLPTPDNPSETKKCDFCGKNNIPLYAAKTEDDFGTRYRKVCEVCYNKHNCQPDDRKRPLV